MGDPRAVASLGTCRKRVWELLNARGDAEDPSGMVDTCRALVRAIDDVLALLQPCYHDKESQYVKAYETFISNNRNVGQESDLAGMVSELQLAATAAIAFLEDADATVASTQSFLGQDASAQHSLLVSQKAALENLRAQKQAAEEAIIENVAKLGQLDNEILECSREVQRLEEITGRSAAALQKYPCLPASEVYDDSAFSAVSRRMASTSCLMSALNVSPLKVVDEGADYIVYKYTLGPSVSTVRVRDSGSGGLNFTLDPANDKAHKYIAEHLRSCKSRRQIAATLQEALSLP